MFNLLDLSSSKGKAGARLKDGVISLSLSENKDQDGTFKGTNVRISFNSATAEDFDIAQHDMARMDITDDCRKLTVNVDSKIKGRLTPVKKSDKLFHVQFYVGGVSLPVMSGHHIKVLDDERLAFILPDNVIKALAKAKKHFVAGE